MSLEFFPMDMVKYSKGTMIGKIVFNISEKPKKTTELAILQLNNETGIHNFENLKNMGYNYTIMPCRINNKHVLFSNNTVSVQK